MASLKRQARKAELYNTYQKKIRKLDIHLGHYHYNEYARHIAETAGLLQTLKDTDIGHTAELKRLDAAIEEIKLQRHQKNQMIGEQKQQKFESQRKVDRFENDLSHMRAELERLKEEVTELEAARENLSTKNQDMLNEIEQGETEARQIEAEVHTLRNQLAEKRSQSAEIDGRVGALKTELDQNKTNLMDLVSKEAQYNNIYQHAASNKDNLSRRIKRADEEEATSRKTIAAAEGKKSEIEAELGRIGAQIKKLEERAGTVRDRLEQTNQELAHQVKHVQSIEFEHNTVKSKIAALKKMEENFEWYRDGVRAVMKNAGNPAQAETADPKVLGGIISLMADIIDPEPTYETAVEAVLGDALQYILVEDQQAGMAAIDYLQTSGAGRSGFIPVKALKTDPPGLEHQSPTEQRLLNHVQVRTGFESIAESLLGHVFFTETLSEAITRFNANGRLQTIVTRSGDVVSSQGMLIGGSKDKLSGILAKKQELRELVANDRELQKKHAAACSDQERLESSARELQTELQSVLEKKADAKDAETEAERQLYEIKTELKSARHHLEVTQLEQEQLMGEASDIDDEMSKYHQALANIATQMKTAQDAVAGLTEELARAVERQEEFNRSEVNVKLEMTALNAKLENSTSSLRRLKEFQADGLKRFEALAQEIIQKKQKQANTESRSSAMEISLSEIYKEIEALAETLIREESDYQAIDAELKSSDDRVADIRTQREKTLEKLRLLELEQSQRSIKQENITTRLEDRYQSSFDDLIAAEGLTDEQIAAVDKAQISGLEAELSDVKTKIARITDVNLGAIKEYEQLKDRYDFLEAQRIDLEKAIEDLYKVIRKINHITQKLFIDTFGQINDKMAEVFPRLFNGGTAKLVLTEPEKPLETGVELMIHPPGKKLTRLSLLSGGEKALSAIAFLFSIFLIKPASFCLLDEIDAPLDDANVFRFNDLLRIIGEKSQIIMITHNKRSMEFADMLFGITMEQKGISKVVSVNLERSRHAA